MWRTQRHCRARPVCWEHRLYLSIVIWQFTGSRVWLVGLPGNVLKRIVSLFIFPCRLSYVYHLSTKQVFVKYYICSYPNILPTVTCVLRFYSFVQPRVTILRCSFIEFFLCIHYRDLVTFVTSFAHAAYHVKVNPSDGAATVSWNFGTQALLI